MTHKPHNNCFGQKNIFERKTTVLSALQSVFASQQLFFAQNTSVARKKQLFFAPCKLFGQKNNCFLVKTQVLPVKNKCFLRPPTVWARKQLFFAQNTFFAKKHLPFLHHKIVAIKAALKPERIAVPSTLTGTNELNESAPNEIAVVANESTIAAVSSRFSRCSVR